MFKLNDNEVLVVPCKSYDREEIAEAYKKIFEYFIDNEIKGKSVYIKPNILKGDKPELASTTNPEVIFPVAKHLSELGCEVQCGDSPNFITVKKVIDSIYSSTGIAKVIEEAGCKMDNSSKGTTVTGGKYLPQFKILTNVLESDIVINMSKAKTHSFTGYTGAVKNLFGVIPGPIKGEMHLSNPNARAFSNVLIDICKTVDADLHIIDGIIGMEGPGPSSGTPKKMGVLIASKNPYAADEVAVELMGLNRENIPQINLAREHGLTKPIDEIKIIGADIKEIKKEYVPFKNAVVSVASYWKVLAFLLPNSLYTRLKKKPYIQSNCIGCGVCEEACPPKAIKIKDIAQINYNKCIKCYCCQELCPAKAIIIGKNGNED
ncbi:MAG: DUF362 domain-containing protein [Eubacteriales bacterium]